MFDHYSAGSWNIIDIQHKVIDYRKTTRANALYAILVAVDDFADDPKICRYNNVNIDYILGKAQFHVYDNSNTEN